MFQVTCRLDFCYGHRLLNHAGKCRFLHGHNALVEIMLANEGLDEHGMVMDFGEIKGGMKDWIDHHLDHRMILHQEDPAIPWMKAQGEPVYIIPHNPTAENIARLIYDQAIILSIPVKRVRLWETPRCHATYS